MTTDKKKNQYTFMTVFSYAMLALTRLLTLLPLKLLLLLSPVVAFVLHKLVRYRLSIVRDNLQNSFPQLTPNERRNIERRFYTHFSDVLFEVTKLKSITINELKLRCRFSEESVKLLNGYYDRGQSIMIVMGHNGNWEWAGASFPLFNKHQIITAYRPLRDKIFDTDTLKMRKRTGNILVSMRKLPREMIKHRDMIKATALIADQTPSKENAFWIKFLNQNTPFFKGPEVLSQKFNTPLFWASVKKIKKGKYTVDVELITDDPSSFNPPGSLTKLFASYLERDIQKQPETWLWSHRRWKHKPQKGLQE